MSECKHRRQDGVCLRDLEYVYKGFCVDGPCTEFEPQTNADRIRAMTDEELAEFLDDVREECGATHYPLGKSSWIDWLKQEAIT